MKQTCRRRRRRNHRRLTQTKLSIPKPKPKRKVYRRIDKNQKRVYKCNRENCGQGFLSRIELKEHKQMFHAKEKKTFLCDMCDYKCFSNCGLISHKRTHTGEKPFTCNECGKAFSQSSSYQHHMMIHAGHKLICEKCGVGLV